VDADELAILFILPGTGVGGGLGRIVGQDYTDWDKYGGQWPPRASVDPSGRQRTVQ
jgi:hypothetical protein